MASQDESTKRREASVPFRKAQEEASKRHIARAQQLLLEALQVDPTYTQARLLLAQMYEQAGDARQASREYQGVLRDESGNEAAWAALQRTDPTAAARLGRVHEIAADPFLAKREGAAAPSGDLADLDPLGTRAASDQGVPGFGLAHAIGEDIAGEIGDVAHAGRKAAVHRTTEPLLLDEVGAGDAGTSAPATPAAAEPLPWEYEQDRQLLARWEALPVVARLLGDIQAVWADPDGLNAVYDLGAHIDRKAHAELVKSIDEVRTSLGLDALQIHVVPEADIDVIAIRGAPPTITLAAGVMRHISVPEQAFMVGRALHPIRAGYLPQWLAAECVLSRRPRIFGDTNDTLREVLSRHASTWLPAELRAGKEKLDKIGHAWQQRVALSADRTGLIACRDLEAACLVLLKATVKSAREAESLHADQYLREFAGVDAGELAAIPTQESPDRSKRYAAYRVQMLRWWASTPEAAQFMR